MDTNDLASLGWSESYSHYENQLKHYWPFEPLLVIYQDQWVLQLCAPGGDSARWSGGIDPARLSTEIRRGCVDLLRPADKPFWTRLWNAFSRNINEMQLGAGCASTYVTAVTNNFKFHSSHSRNQVCIFTWRTITATATLWSDTSAEETNRTEDCQEPLMTMEMKRYSSALKSVRAIQLLWTHVEGMKSKGIVCF